MADPHSQRHTGASNKQFNWLDDGIRDEDLYYSNFHYEGRPSDLSLVTPLV